MMSKDGRPFPKRHVPRLDICSFDLLDPSGYLSSSRPCLQRTWISITTTNEPERLWAILLMTYSSNMVDGTRNVTVAIPVLVRASIVCEGLSVLLTNFLALSLCVYEETCFSFVFLFLFYSCGLKARSNASMIAQGKWKTKERRWLEQSSISREITSLPRGTRQITCHT